MESTSHIVQNLPVLHDYKILKNSFIGKTAPDVHNQAKTDISGCVCVCVCVCARTHTHTHTHKSATSVIINFLFYIPKTINF